MLFFLQFLRVNFWLKKDLFCIKRFSTHSFFFFFSDLIFLQGRALSEQYEYSPKGQRAEVIRTSNSQRNTVISAIGHVGYLGIQVLGNPGQRFNRFVFADFLRNIVSLLNPYNAGEKRSLCGSA